MSDNNETKNNYKEFGDKVKSTIGAVGAGLETTAKEVSHLDISNSVRSAERRNQGNGIEGRIREEK